MREGTENPSSFRTALALGGEAIGLIGAYVRSLAIYEVMFYVLGSIVFAPMVAWSTDLLIRSTGRTAVSNFDIVTFVMSPRGMAAVGIAVTAYLVLRYMQEAVILRRLDLPLPGHKHDWLAAMLGTRRALGRLAGLGLVQFGIVVVAAVPVIAAAFAIKRGLLTGHDLNYYLAVQPPELQRAKLIMISSCGS